MVIEHAKRLMEKGESEVGQEAVEVEEERWDADAMGSLTMGAILTLKVGRFDPPLLIRSAPLPCLKRWIARDR